MEERELTVTLTLTKTFKTLSKNISESERETTVLKANSHCVNIQLISELTLLVFWWCLFIGLRTFKQCVMIFLETLTYSDIFTNHCHDDELSVPANCIEEYVGVQHGRNRAVNHS